MIRGFIAIVFAVCFSVNAYSQVPFECNDQFYQVFTFQGQQLAYDLVSNTFVIAPNNAGEGYNAVGYRIADNFAYGLASTGNLLQISADGSVIDLGPVAGLAGSAQAGDFGPDGLLYIHQNAVVPAEIVGIDVDTVTAVNFVNLSGPDVNFPDIALNPTNGLFYAVNFSDTPGANPGDLVTIDIVTGTVSIVGPTNVSGVNPRIASMWSGASGNVFGGDRNNNGFVYQFDTQTGNATLVGRTFTDADGIADGWCCSAGCDPPAIPGVGVPTLSQWGLIAMAGILGIAGFIMVIRRRKVTA